MNWTGHSHMKSSETKISYQCEISSETAKNVEVVFQTRIEELSNLGCSVAAFRFLALAAVIAESAHAAEEGYSFRDVCLGPSQRKGLPCQGCTTGKQGCVRTRWRCVRPHDETARNTHTQTVPAKRDAARRRKHPCSHNWRESGTGAAAGRAAGCAAG